MQRRAGDVRGPRLESDHSGFNTAVMFFVQHPGQHRGSPAPLPPIRAPLSGFLSGFKVEPNDTQLRLEKMDGLSLTMNSESQLNERRISSFCAAVPPV